MRCDQGHEWDENGVCKEHKVMKEFKVQFEEVVTCEVVVVAETPEDAQNMVESGEYDPNDSESCFHESDRYLRDIVDVKEYTNE